MGESTDSLLVSSPSEVCSQSCAVWSERDLGAGHAELGLDWRSRYLCRHTLLADSLRASPASESHVSFVSG